MSIGIHALYYIVDVHRLCAGSFLFLLLLRRLLCRPVVVALLPWSLPVVVVPSAPSSVASPAASAPALSAGVASAVVATAFASAGSAVAAASAASVARLVSSSVHAAHGHPRLRLLCGCVCDVAS